MPRYKLTIAYDGTRFCGWQKQEPPTGTSVRHAKVMLGPGIDGEPDPSQAPGDHPAPESHSAGDSRVILRTVQEVLERAVREVVREPVLVKGASRTDSGVHARGQVACFTCAGGEPITLPREAGASEITTPRGGGWPVSRGVDTLVRAINSRLPRDVLVRAAEVVPLDFDPITDCIAKGYSYTLHVARDRSLWDRDYVHHIWVPLDLERMNEAARLLVGEHDFAGFAAAGHGRLSTVRTVFDCRVTEEPTADPAPLPSRRDIASHDEHRARRLRIEISGSGFLWNMVRIVAGTLVDAGRGRITPERIAQALATGDRRLAGPTLPASGLCLEWIRYRQSDAESLRPGPDAVNNAPA